MGSTKADLALGLHPPIMQRHSDRTIHRRLPAETTLLPSCNCLAYPYTDDAGARIMYEVSSNEMHPDFPNCWRAAGIHLQNRVQGKLSWLKATLVGPALEHLSFRLGNQLFFIRLEDVQGEVGGPGNLGGLLSIADACNGVPCIMPMRSRQGRWEPTEAGWGLLHARTHRAVDPLELVTADKIEMTAWELQDFAVQVVRDTLAKQGLQIASTQSNPSVNPSIWIRTEVGLEFVIVRAARHPAPLPSLPENVEAIAEGCKALSSKGSFAPVVVANAEDPFAPNGEGALPLWRGHALVVRFEGLKPL